MPLEELKARTKANLPTGAHWVTQFPATLTMFTGICPECQLSIVWCLTGDLTRFVPNNSACQNSFSVEQIFPPEKEPEISKAHATIFQPRETPERTSTPILDHIARKFEQTETHEVVRFYCNSCQKNRTSFKNKAGRVICPRCKSEIFKGESVEES